MRDTFWLNQTGLEFDAIFDRSYLVVDPEEAAEAVLTVILGTSAPAGRFDFSVSVESGSDCTANASVQMGVTMLPHRELWVTADRTVVTTRPGRMESVNMTITNRGNVLDVVDVYMYLGIFENTILVVDGNEYLLSSDLVAPIQLGPGESTLLTLRIAVPTNATGGSQVLYGDFSSQTDPLVDKTLNITVFVRTEKPWYKNMPLIGGLAGAAAAAAGRTAQEQKAKGKSAGQRAKAPR